MRQGVNVEKALALHMARNAKDSRFGLALLEENTKETRLLDRKIQRLEKERYRKSLHAAQVRNMFLHERASLPEPLLIVERPPSPEVLRRVAIFEQEVDDDVPGYRKPLKTKARAPSTLLTIDAFAVRNRKKVNVWEDALADADKPHFQSAVLPSFPLTEPEVAELERGRRVHRPKSHPSKRTSRSRGQGQAALTPAGPRDLDLEYGRRHQVDNSRTFITQLPLDGDTDAMLGKTVRFSVKLDATQSRPVVRVPAATALVASKDGYQAKKTQAKSDTKSVDFKVSLRKWLKKTENLF